MTLLFVVGLAFLIGCVCGSRSLTGPALICWGAHLGWLHLDGSTLSFLHTPVALVVSTLLAVGELVADKLPIIPGRIEAGPLVARFLTGGMCGAALCLSIQLGWLPGTLAGGFGAVAFAFAGYYLRRWLTMGRGLPDVIVALAEDAIAIGGGLLVVSRF